MNRAGLFNIVVWSVVATACGGDSSSSPSTFPSSVPGVSRSSQGASDGPQVSTPGVVASASSCAVVRNGSELMASGAMQSDGTLVATHVIGVPPSAGDAPAPTPTPVPSEPPPGSVPGTMISIAARGVAAGVSGQCPDVLFTLGDTRVRTNSVTQFFGG